MKDAGYAHMGVGRATGKDKAEEAANMAISSPLLETAINGAKGVIINVTASPDIGLDEIETASSMIAQQADPSANIIWGAAFDESMDDEISVTVIATGFSKRESEFPIHSSNKGSNSSYSDNLRNFSAAKNDSEKGADDESFYDIMSIFKNRYNY
jgi:cell division protein FtsZ